MGPDKSRGRKGRGSGFDRSDWRDLSTSAIRPGFFQVVQPTAETSGAQTHASVEQAGIVIRRYESGQRGGAHQGRLDGRCDGAHRRRPFSPKMSRRMAGLLGGQQKVYAMSGTTFVGF